MYLAFSADGLQWSHAKAIHWPPPQRWDCLNNLAFDTADGGRWVATTRDGFAKAPGRTIGIALSSTGALAWNTTEAPREALAGSSARQLYSQVTFPWLNVWLGLVMVYHAKEPAERVRCHLAWARTPDAEWQWVDPLGLQDGAREAIPLGDAGTFDSHICFAASTPRRVGEGASAHERLYYMGGNGPHGGARNSSLGLAILRPDGYAAVRSTHGIVFTTPLICTGRTLHVTADVDAGVGGGALQIGAAEGGPYPAPAALRAAHAVPLTANVTNAPMRYESGSDWSALVGREVVLEIRLTRAGLYSLGWE